MNLQAAVFRKVHEPLIKRLMEPGFSDSREIQKANSYHLFYW
jgi:hypothetical protein